MSLSEARPGFETGTKNIITRVHTTHTFAKFLDKFIGFQKLCYVRVTRKKVCA